VTEFDTSPGSERGCLVASADTCQLRSVRRSRGSTAGLARPHWTGVPGICSLSVRSPGPRALES
jgi:hypothetical protein